MLSRCMMLLALLASLRTRVLSAGRVGCEEAVGVEVLLAREGEGVSERPNAEAKGARISERDGMISFAASPELYERGENEGRENRRGRGGTNSRRRRR